MSQILIDKIRQSRQQTVEVEGLRFTVRRPTDLETLHWLGDGLEQDEILRRFVIGWDGVKEADLINGGTPKPVEFDSDLFMEWVADRPQTWAPLIEAITTAYREHQRQLEDSLKKPASG